MPYPFRGAQKRGCHKQKRGYVGNLGLIYEKRDGILNAMKRQGVLLAFRCEAEFVERVNAAASCLEMKRTAFVLKAVDVFLKEVAKRKGFVIPPYYFRRKRGRKPKNA